MQQAITRERAFTLLAKAYEHVRRGVQFVRAPHGDADRFAPSLVLFIVSRSSRCLCAQLGRSDRRHGEATRAWAATRRPDFGVGYTAIVTDRAPASGLPPTVPQHVTQAAHDFAGRLRARLGARLLDLRVFGSCARGDVDQGSDLDVLVVVDEADGELRRRVFDCASEFLWELGLVVAPTILDRSTFELHRRQARPLVTTILREGIPL